MSSLREAARAAVDVLRDALVGRADTITIGQAHARLLEALDSPSPRFYLAVVRMPNTHYRTITTTASSPRQARRNTEPWLKHNEIIERLYVEARDWKGDGK